MREPLSRTGPLVALWPLCQAASAIAGLQTIHEGGPTVPIAPYMEPFERNEAPAQPPVALPSITQQALPVAFPVQTTSMRPGRLSAPVRLRTPGGLPAPMFIVGDDALSHQWLAANRQRLARMGASGVVANVTSLEALQALRRVAPGLPLAPAPLDSLAQDLGLGVYPVLIKADGQITQKVR
jgi:integrating conjugative element protein (TIGR03765 family)